MPRNVSLPDGRTLVIPDDATPDQLAALKLKLGAKYPDLKTGAGMEQYAQEQARQPKGVLARPAMPGTSSRFAGPQSKALTPEQRKSRDIPFEVAKVAAPTVLTAVAPEAVLPGAIANVVGRGAGALGGASYGGKLASEAGLPKWVGQAVGGATGALAPEIVGKLSSPLIAKIASMLGKKAPEVLETIAADTSVEGRVGRDIAERAARGEPLSPMDEEILLQQVQQHYTPEAGVESSAQKAGKIYAGRGTKFRPTNEQLAIAKQRGFTPPPSPAEAAPAAPNRPWEVQTPQVAYRARPVGERGIPKADYPQATTNPAKAAEYAKSLANQTGKPHEVATIDLTKTPKAMRAMQPGSEHMIQFGAEHPESVVTDKSAPFHPEIKF